ncbi:phage minor capsid protein [Anaerococcus rubeinfantis]|uniref:phage minor capsid protein n=1 Tax=Anaerococcus rubeinfantis TaxID=1720199 RepID=UPI00073F1359|nr:phage minor capsid protein [Anaerococcus rubeinfantis]
MLSPEYMERVTDNLIELYQDLEDAILEDIAKRINKNGYLTATAERQAEVLIQNGYTTEEIESLLKPHLEDIDEEISDIITRSSLKHYEDEAKAYRSVNKSLVDLSKNNHVNNTIASAMDRLIEGNGNITKSLGVVYNGENIKLNNFYMKSLNQAAFQVASGAFSRQQVVRSLINNLSDSGIRVINYQQSGRNYTVESAAKMLVRTTLNQMTGDISLMNAEDMGQDLMEISAHAGARPSHAEWQGQIVSLSGDNDKYLSLDDIGYGDVTGFMGANCRHNWYPFFEGISERAWTKEMLDNIDPEPFEFEDKEYTYYEATQKQRQIERTIRKYKHRVMMYDKVGDNESKLIAQVRLQRQRQLYKDFNKAGKLRPTSVNTNVYRYSKDRYNEEIKSRKLRDIYTEKRFMQSRLDYINPITNFKEFIPSKTIINHSKAIYKGDEIRVVNKLCEKYGGKPNEWSKMVGRVDSELYYYDVHWYEKNNIQYEMKFKHKSRRKK